MSNISLLFSSVLLLIPLFISYKENLDLEKDIIIAAIRATIQLFLVGFVLKFIFDSNSSALIIIMIISIIFNASWNTKKRNDKIDGIFKIAFASISLGVIITLVTLLVTGSINWSPNEVIPVTGMLAASSMTGLNLSLNSMYQSFTDSKQKVLEKLSLGANMQQASKTVIRKSIKNGLIPQIDSAKTVGLVSLPGMMSGLLIAGADPIQAIKYQLMVTFMMLGAVTLTIILATYLSYRKFYNSELQLLTD